MAEMDLREVYDSAAILIYDRKRDIKSEERSLIAFDKARGKIIAVGNEAQGWADRESEGIVVASPLKNGVIADYTIAQAMFRAMMKKVSAQKTIFKPRVAVCIPEELTEVERKAFTDAFYQAGAGKVAVFEGMGEENSESSQSIPPAFNLIVTIRPKEDQKKAGREVWHEVCIGQIPSDSYEIRQINRQGTETLITLFGSANRVEIKFQNVIAMRVMDKEMVPRGFFSENELAKLRKDRFKNVIYRIDGGEFGRFIRENGRGNIKSIYCSHYIIMGREEGMEIMAEKEPEISVKLLSL